MTLQRRVLLYLALCAPLVWAAGLLFGLSRARLEINELFDTQQALLARQVLATLPSTPLQAITPKRLLPQVPSGEGQADPDSMAIAVWDRRGELLLTDSEGAHVPFVKGGNGFVDQDIEGQAWRTYYLPSPAGEWLVAVGQQREERSELVRALLAGQLLPWVLTLPLLLLAMAAAVRQALKPVRALALELQQRGADELRALPEAAVPGDLLPLVQAMNGLLQRMQRTLEQERRFTADAAHELRTPLTALQAQWDAARLAAARRGQADEPGAQKIGEGLQRLSRLVAQMLALARLEHLDALEHRAPIAWPELVAQVFSDVLPLAELGRVELSCEWPPNGGQPLLRDGDAELLAALLRNLLDNAVRHTPADGQVQLRLGEHVIEVLDSGAGVPEALLPRLGERFHRFGRPGHSGSGLGLSIALRIAALHGLRLSFCNRVPAPGLCARLEQGG